MRAGMVSLGACLLGEKQEVLKPIPTHEYKVVINRASRLLALDDDGYYE